MQSRDVNTKIICKRPWLSNINSLHPSFGVPFLNSIILMNIINTDGAQAGLYRVSENTIISHTVINYSYISLTIYRTIYNPLHKHHDNHPQEEEHEEYQLRQELEKNTRIVAEMPTKNIE